MIILASVAMLLVGIVNAFKDASALNVYNLDWWNKGRSWKKKWKLNSSETQPIPNDKKPWYYLGLYKPKYVERFPYSSTVLVSYTDGWHFLQLIQFTIIQLALAIAVGNSLFSIAILFMLFKVTFSVVFEMTYKQITK